MPKPHHKSFFSLLASVLWIEIGHCSAQETTMDTSKHGRSTKINIRYANSTEKCQSCKAESDHECPQGWYSYRPTLKGSFGKLSPVHLVTWQTPNSDQISANRYDMKKRKKLINGGVRSASSKKRNALSLTKIVIDTKAAIPPAVTSSSFWHSSGGCYHMTWYRETMKGGWNSACMPHRLITSEVSTRSLLLDSTNYSLKNSPNSVTFFWSSLKHRERNQKNFDKHSKVNISGKIPPEDAKFGNSIVQ